MHFLKGIVYSNHFLNNWGWNLKRKVCKSGLNIIQIYVGNISEVSVIWWIEIRLVISRLHLMDQIWSWRKRNDEICPFYRYLATYTFCFVLYPACNPAPIFYRQARHSRFSFLSITAPPPPTIFFQNSISNIALESRHFFLSHITPKIAYLPAHLFKDS